MFVLGLRLFVTVKRTILIKSITIMRIHVIDTNDLKLYFTIVKYEYFTIVKEIIKLRGYHQLEIFKLN